LLLAERELTFGVALPADLAREWNAVDAEYARVQASLSRSRLGRDDPEIDNSRVRLAELAIRREELRGRVRAASPRVAALRYPEPLSAPASAAQLDPDTAMLSYVVGRTETVLFVVRPPGSPGERLPVLRLAVGEVEL